MKNSGNELRLFISSTFHDLQAERGYLIKHVFPQLRAICRQRGIEFTEIDLRWGLTAEESSLGKVIRTCLEEIDHCRPYFLGLLGERYGWVPHLAEVQKDYQLVREYPWVEDAAIRGASLVEIEFLQGLKNAELDQSGTFFHSVPPRTTGTEDHRLKALRDSIQARGVPFAHFQTVEELGSQVLAELTALIDRDWPAHAAYSQLEAERTLQETFAATRRKSYIANPATIRALETHLKENAAPLCIHGLSGAGKSALLAFFAQFTRRSDPERIIITHFVGASPASIDGGTVLRHILLELREQFQLEEDVPETREQMIECLPKWLAQRSDKRVLLILDAINQIDGPDSAIGWLPDYSLPNLAVIVSTITGEISQALVERGYQLLKVDALDGESREALVVRFLGEYHKGLSRDQLQLITKDRNASSPLFLRTVLEELRLSGEYELLDETISHYLSARDLNELFQLVLQRMENDYGVELVKSVLSFIAHSRQGLSEPELLELTKCDRFSLSVFLLALDYHLMKPMGRYAFFHDYLKNAVISRYLRNPAISRDTHRTLAKYFTTQPMSRRRIEEEPWQWMKAGLHEELLQSVCELGALEMFIELDKTYELIGYWNKLDATPSEYFENARLALKELDDPAHYALFAWRVSRILVLASFYKEAEALLKEALEVQTELVGENDATAAEMLSDLGALWQQLGRYAEAEGPLRKSLEIIQTLLGPEDPKTADALSNLATLLYRKRDFVEAKRLYNHAFLCYEKTCGYGDPRTINALTDLGSIEYEEGSDQAEITFRRALELSDRYVGKRHPATAEILNNLGAFSIAQNNLRAAYEYLKMASEMNEATFGTSSVITLRNKINVALTARRLKLFEEAEQIYRDIVPKLDHSLGRSHPDTISALNNFALLLIDLNHLEEAEERLTEVLHLHERGQGPEALSTIQAHLNLAKVLAARNAKREAAHIYQVYLPKKIALLGENHPSVLFSKAEEQAIFH